MDEEAQKEAERKAAEEAKAKEAASRTDDPKDRTPAKIQSEENMHKSKAEQEVDRINADTDKINKAVAENENAKARLKLGGKAEAGKEPEKPKEETPQEYAERISKGELKEGEGTPYKGE